MSDWETKNLSEEPDKPTDGVFARVIPCKHCEYFSQTAIGWCMNHDIPTFEDRYCAWAKEMKTWRNSR